jgi:enamine deaminase RidA (YjgF/YER057c/UK114 family)
MTAESRVRISSGGPWEARVGYSRAVRAGDRVWVSGTTGTAHDGTVPPGMGAQAHLALDTIEHALREAGSSPDEAVCVRIYVTDIEQWEAVAGQLRSRFGRARPAMTMVQVARLMLPEHLVEIEVEAVVGSA